MKFPSRHYDKITGKDVPKLGRPPVHPDVLKVVITFRMKRIDSEYMVLKAKSLGFTKSKFILKCIEDKLFNIP